MDWQREQKIIKHLNSISEQIDGVEKILGYIDGVSKHVRNIHFELLHIIRLLKLDNEKKENKNGKKEAIQHKNEG